MFWPRYLLGISIAITALLLVVQLDSSVAFLLVPPAIIVVIGGSLGLLVATFSARDLRRCAQVAVGNLEGTTPEERDLALAVISAGMRYAFAFGVLGMVVALMGMLQNLDDPKRLGPYMAIALTGPFYALLLGEALLAPFWYRVSCGVRPSGASSPTRNPPTFLVLGGLLLAFMLCFFILLFSLSTLDVIRLTRH